MKVWKVWSLNHWVEISERNLGWNYGLLRQSAGADTEILAVVKANAYGHGAEICSVALVRAGARWLGVTCAEEGVRVRRALSAASVAAEILLMSGSLVEDLEAIREAKLTPVVWTTEQVAWLRGFPGIKVHVEVDTGMGRQGVRVEGLPALLEAVRDAGLTLGGVFTHFCSSEVAASELTKRQQSRFEQAVAQARATGFQPEWVHAGNSSSLDNPADPPTWLARLAATVGARAMVRSGLALYGYCLDIEGEAAPQVRRELRSVMTWKAKVLAVRELAVGDTVGYNATFTAQWPMRVALLPVGYADGLRRELSYSVVDGKAQGGWVVIRGREAPVVGRISMNLTVVDVTEFKTIEAGDDAVVLGPGITADDHARLAGTIPYEILCGVRSELRLLGA